MPDLPEVYPTPLDLTRYTEAARRELYDRLIRIQFGTPAADPEEPPIIYTPDEVGLMVFYVFGRWFGVWKAPEESDHLPAARRIEVVRIQVDPAAPDGIMLYEVWAVGWDSKPSYPVTARRTVTVKATPAQQAAWGLAAKRQGMSRGAFLAWSADMAIAFKEAFDRVILKHDQEMHPENYPELWR
jgi:hypothetical protein